MTGDELLDSVSRLLGAKIQKPDRISWRDNLQHSARRLALSGKILS